MAKKKKNNKKKKANFKQVIIIEVVSLLLIAISIVTLAKLGAVGKLLVTLFRFFLGEWYILGAVGLLVYAVYLMIKREQPQLFTMRLSGIYIIVAALLLFSHLSLFNIITQSESLTNKSVIANTWTLFFQELRAGGETATDLGGGMIGALMFAVFHYLFSATGVKIVAAIMTLIGGVLLTGKSLGETIKVVAAKLQEFFKEQYKKIKTDLKKETNKAKKQNKELLINKKQETITDDDNIIEYSEMPGSTELIITPPEEDSRNKASEQEKTVNVRNTEDIETSNDTETERTEPEVTFSNSKITEYNLPSVDLLAHPYETDQSGEYKKIHENAAKLEKTFQSFGVKARVTQVHLGPSVTKFEVQPDAGVKVSRIVSLSDDLALALAAKDIRIEAPIPGKSAIGIEVPNSEIAVVSLKEVLQSKQNDTPDEKLLIGLGRDVTGNAVLSRLNKMPHLLIAGATGSGKSVCVNGIITSILMRARPDEVKLMMIDPKKVELNVYNGIPHLLAPVVTNPKKAAQALHKVVLEMERRYELFSETGTRNIEGYNDFIRIRNESEEIKTEELPYIVVIVDELADLMMVASNDVEDAIIRLAQMARAAGIHLIIATQRPSVDVITGIIKANIPSRIAFAVSSATDSRTILDMGGAEKLLGRGDMLFLPVGSSKPIRVQGAYLSDEEVEAVVSFVSSQQEAQYQEEMIPTDEPEKMNDVDDELYDDAVALIAEMQTASVSMLQRRFRIGYARAARLIDEMEARGIVGPYEGSRPRTVLIPKPSEEIS